MVLTEDTMKLRDVFLCIDCDEMFTLEGSPCNPRCPRCASSVLMPMSAFVRTLTAFERGTDEMARPRLEIIQPTSVAA
jgi:DNA-directed RNA polymerase subunit RPC12/RpoP